MSWQEFPRWDGGCFRRIAKHLEHGLIKKLQILCVQRAGLGEVVQIGLGLVAGKGRVTASQKAFPTFQAGRVHMFLRGLQRFVWKEHPAGEGHIPVPQAEEFPGARSQFRGRQARPGIAGYFAMEMGLAHLCKCGKLPAQGGFIHKNGFIGIREKRQGGTVQLHQEDSLWARRCV